MWQGGFLGANLNGVTIQLDGTLQLCDDIDEYPKGIGKDPKMPVDGIHLANITNVTITSSAQGGFDGNGDKWWGFIK